MKSLLHTLGGGHEKILWHFTGDQHQGFGGGSIPTLAYVKAYLPVNA